MLSANIYLTTQSYVIQIFKESPGTLLPNPSTALGDPDCQGAG